MTETAFQLLRNNLRIGERTIPKDQVEMVETHISYLLLLKDEVYKLKKTVKLPFVDFSELPQRKHACSQELHLNRRLAPDVYLDMVAVKETQGAIGIDTAQGEIIDYAVRMKRIDNALEMDRLLERKAVGLRQIDSLAGVIAGFHRQAFPVKKIWKAEHLQATYNQLAEWASFAGTELGTDYGHIIEQSCRVSDTFINEHIDLINRRSRLGYVRDLHGDLHSHNIFLTEPPVVFDCIEFDEDLRQIDLLNEIAFFIMDLEFFRADDLAAYFIERYVYYLHDADLSQLMNDELLLYFKMYRASVRAKVLMVGARHSVQQKQEHLEEIGRYLQLVGRYLKQMV